MEEFDEGPPPIGELLNGQEHGYWEFYYRGGQILCKGCYYNGKEVGYWEWFSPINYKIDGKWFYIK